MTDPRSATPTTIRPRDIDPAGVSIQQARADWRAGRFTAVPGETERAILPQRDAFCEEHCS